MFVPAARVVKKCELRILRAVVHLSALWIQAGFLLRIARQTSGDNDYLSSGKQATVYIPGRLLVLRRCTSHSLSLLA